MTLLLSSLCSQPGAVVLKPQCATESPPVSDSVGLDWGLRICTSNKFLGAAEAAGLGPRLETHCPEEVEKKVVL